MRTGQFTDSYLPIVNGVSIFVQVFKQTLERLGHEPYVFTFGHTQYDDRESNVIRSPGLPLGSSGYHVGPRYSPHARALSRSMDVLHAHHPFVGGMLAARLSRQLNKPLIFTNHTRYDYYAHHYLRILPRRTALGLLGAWMRRFTRRCDLVIAVSRSAQSMLESLGVDTPIEIIPNGIDLHRFERATPLPKSDLELPPDAIVLMYVGRLGPEKNLNTLLESFAQARHSAPRMVLALVGDGPQAASVKKMISELNLDDSVRLLGMRSNDDIPSLLGASDAFVTASVTEGHPMTIIEALAAHRPVLAFDVPGIRETVVDGKNGLLAQIDARALAENMARIASDADLRARLSEGARHTATQYSMDITTRRIVAHYERLIRERNPRPIGS